MSEPVPGQMPLFLEAITVTDDPDLLDDIDIDEGVDDGGP